MRQLILALYSAVGIGAITTGASAEPRYKLNKAQTRAVALSGLSSGGDPCHPFNTTGRVTEQNFSGVSVTGFTLAVEDGSRIFINVNPINIENAGNMLAVGWINDGLQKMLRKGKRVSVRVDACGAAGRMMFLDAVRPQ